MADQYWRLRRARLCEAALFDGDFNLAHMNAIQPPHVQRRTRFSQSAQDATRTAEGGGRASQRAEDSRKCNALGSFHKTPSPLGREAKRMKDSRWLRSTKQQIAHYADVRFRRNAPTRTAICTLDPRRNAHSRSAIRRIRSSPSRRLTVLARSSLTTRLHPPPLTPAVRPRPSSPAKKSCVAVFSSTGTLPCGRAHGRSR